MECHFSVLPLIKLFNGVVSCILAFVRWLIALCEQIKMCETCKTWMCEPVLKSPVPNSSWCPFTHGSASVVRSPTMILMSKQTESSSMAEL